MKTYFLYNVLLNVALILMGFAVWAAFDSNDNESRTFIIVIAVTIFLVLAYLKYRLLTYVRKGFKDN